MTRRNLLIAALVCLSLASLSGWVYVLADCGDTWQQDGADTFGGACGSAGQITTLTQTKHWRIFWTDGYERKDAQVSERGDCKAGYFTNTMCYPRFHTPYWAASSSRTGTFTQQAQRSGYNDVDDDGTCILENTVTHVQSLAAEAAARRRASTAVARMARTRTAPACAALKAAPARAKRCSASTVNTST